MKTTQAILVKKVAVPRRCKKCGGFSRLVQKPLHEGLFVTEVDRKTTSKCVVKLKEYVERTVEVEGDKPAILKKSEEKQDKTDDMDSIWDSDSSSVL